METITCEDHFRLGCDCRKQKDYAQAANHFRNAIALDPFYAAAHAELGAALIGLAGKAKGVLPEARRALETALQLDPEDGWSELFLTNLFQRTGEIPEAEKYFKSVLARWPNLGIAHIHYGLFIDEHFKDYTRAKFHLKKAVALGPNDDGSLYSLGMFLCRHSRIKEGERFLKRAAELGHAHASHILNRQFEYVPKLQRWQICVECGSLLNARESWWCNECGADLRIKPYQLAHEYQFEPRFRRQALPR